MRLRHADELERRSRTARSISTRLPDVLTVRRAQRRRAAAPGRGGPRRTLKSLLQEAHVPVGERARLPLLFAGDTLLAVADCGSTRRSRRRGRRRAAKSARRLARSLEPSIARVGHQRRPSCGNLSARRRCAFTASILYTTGIPANIYDAFRIRHRWRRVLIGQGHRRRLARARFSRPAASRSRWSSSTRTSTWIRAP